MNEMAFQVRYHVERNGRLDRCETSTINHQLRGTLHNKGEHVFPLDLVAQLLAARD